MGSYVFLPFPKWQKSDSSKVSEFADDNFKIDENGTKFSRQVEKEKLNGLIMVY